MTTRRKWTLAITALAVAAVIVILLWLGPSEPSYAGLTLTEWIQLEFDQYPHPEKLHLRLNGGEAVQKIGTNAIPYLLRWIAESESAPPEERALAWIAAHLPKRLAPDNPAHWTGAEKRLSRGEIGRLGLSLLEPDTAQEAIPELEKMATKSTRSLCLDALSFMGTRARPALERIATNTNAPRHALATLYLKDLEKQDRAH